MGKSKRDSIVFGHNAKLVTIGQETMSIKAWCERYGTNVRRAYQRIRDGWTPEDAVRKRRQTYADTYGDTLSYTARKFGVNPHTAIVRRLRGLKGAKLLAEGSVRVYVGKHGLDNPFAKRVTVDGKDMCLTDAMKRIGLSASAYRGRLKSGWKEYEALTRARTSNSDRTAKQWANRRRRELASIGVLI